MTQLAAKRRRRADEMKNRKVRSHSVSARLLEDEHSRDEVREMATDSMDASTTTLTLYYSTQFVFVWLARFARPSLKMRTISLRSAQIRDLEAQVRELEETANRRAAPDSISQLIRAIGPSESVEVKRKETNREVVNLRKELAQTEADGEKRLRSLRQQFERVKLGLEGELSSLKRKMGSGGGVSSSVDKSSTGTGTTGTGGDVEKLRAFYNKKIADAEKKHTAALHAAKRGASNVSKSNPIKVDKNNAVERVRELEGLVSKQKEMILTLETLSSVKKGKGADNNSSVRSSNGEAAATAVNVAKIGQLEQMNVFLERQVKDLTSSLAGAETRVAQQQVSERTERALWKTGILATTKLTLFHSIRCSKIKQQTQAGKFKGKVIGPIGSFLKIKPNMSKWAGLTEVALGNNVMSAFVCERKEDVNLLVKLRQDSKIGGNQCNIFQQTPYARYKTKPLPVNSPEIQSPLTVLDVEDDLVFNFLVDQGQADQRAIASTKKSSEEHLMVNRGGRFETKGNGGERAS